MPHGIDLDSVLDSLTDGNHSLCQSYEAVPTDIGILMNQALSSTGIQPDYTEIIVPEIEMPLIPEHGKRQTRTRVAPQYAYCALPEHLGEKLAQANMSYIRGDTAKSLSLLYDIIRERPDSVGAWKALSIMHEDNGEISKALQSNMMAAHLSPKDGELWYRLGTMSLELNLKDQGLYCFSKAAKCLPNNFDVLWNKAVLLAELGNTLMVFLSNDRQLTHSNASCKSSRMICKQSRSYRDSTLK